jgi:hypothetical protein
MPMLLHAPNQLYCTHCEFSYSGEPPVLRHPSYDKLAMWLPSAKVLNDVKFLARVKTCPHQGQSFQFPEAVRKMDEVGR